MYRALLVLLCVVHLVTASVTPQMLQAMRSGQRVDVIMNNGTRVTGKLASVDALRFEVQPEKRGAPARLFSYDDVAQVRRKMTKTAKWTIAALVYGALTLVGAIVGG